MILLFAIALACNAPITEFPATAGMSDRFATIGSFSDNLEAFSFEQRLDALSNESVVVG